MKSWKIGAISGLIAGIIAGIVCEYSNQLGNLLGLFDPYWKAFNTGNIIINIPIFGFWGIILGIIYSRIYYVVPKKAILKGVIFGLFIWFITKIRLETFELAYGRFIQAVGAISYGFFMWLSYGLVLGILYESLHKKYNIPKEKKKIIRYDMSSGILPGAISGLCGGVAASVFAVMGQITENWGVLTAGGQLISTIEFWWSQAGTHILINMIWGTIFALFFTKVYNLVPGKGVKKGLYYGLILYAINVFMIGTYCVPWAIYHNDWTMAQYYAGALWIIGGANAVVYGLVLGYLYKK
ncbi:hypothetical protein [[Eubacterium] cellulosolvens]